MKLEEQVLSIEQVRELQELEFDTSKYASMCWVKYTSDEEPYEETYNLTVLDENCYEMSCLSPIPTLTVADIIDILPNLIIKSHNLYKLKISLDKDKYRLFYLKINGRKSFNLVEKENLIDALFQTLKWCIKEKHIEL